MISIEKMKAVNNDVEATSLEDTAIKYNLPVYTIKDYVWRWRKYCKDKMMTNQSAKILLFDLETNFMKNATWNLYPNAIHISQILEDWSMISWSAKWLFEDEIHSGVVTPEESILRNDKQITNSLWKLIDEADIIIAHNLNKFDRKKMNTCFFKYRLGHPSPYQMIDTLQIARHNFAISSNKLDYLAKFLGIPGKFETGFKLWLECDGHDAVLNEELITIGNKIQKVTTYNRKVIEEALDHMIEYNKNDVSMLENIYLELRPYDRRHPNLALYGEGKEGQCHVCGSVNLSPTSKQYHTSVSRFDVYKCNDCGAYSRVRFADKRSRDMLRGTAR